ncbi:MAG TPA: cytochrome c [Bryobacteraceae bacterium]|nr:cytochrome c [Bryobacteraceae bacterium]
MRTLSLMIASCVMGFTALAATNTPASVTFNKDVLPILQKNCQGCHRPGEIAPFSLLTYNDARPWAKAMKVAVATKKMPPWFAEVGHFANDRRLSDADINTLVAWADKGAPEGDAKDRPAPITFQDGWNIKPDMIIEMPKDFHVKATGTINYQNILVKANFPEDTWVVAAEMRPGNAKVVHHMRAIVRPPTSTWLAKAVPGEAYEEGSEEMGGARQGTDLLGKYNPGLGAQTFDIDGSAKFVPKGSDIVFNIHYTAVGTEQTDRSKVGLVFAKNPPKLRYWMSPGTPAAFNLAIPAGDNNAEVVSEVTVGVDGAKLVYIQPHLHLRGKDYELRVTYPTGESEVVFKGTWNFDWQVGYQLAKPLALPKGTKLLAVVHYDNSINNKFNPDPTKTVWWGDQNWDEMQSGFLGLTFDVNTDANKVFIASGPSLLPRGTSGPTLVSMEAAAKK